MTTLPRVLIVDYDPKALRSLQEVFVDSGYQVRTAKDGIAALASFKEFKPAVVLLEAMIPKKHGFEVCQEIKKTPEGRSTPVIIMSAVYKGRKYRTQAMHVHGCDEFVEKPCSPDSLLEIVKRFVPPGVVSKPAPMAPTHPEKRGTVIPFPADRSGFLLSDFEGDVEREIMSKLDEIMPDTPMFSQRGTDGAMTAVAPPAIETVAKFATAAAVSAAPEGGESQVEKPAVVDRTQTGRASAATPDDVMTLVKARKRAVAGSPEGGKTRRLVSPLVLTVFILSVLVAVAAYVLGHS